MVKQATRSQLRDTIAALTDQQRHAKSMAACEHLCATTEFRQTIVVMLFLSLSNEIDTAHAFLRAFQQNKTVVVPSIIWHERHLVPVTITSLDCDMTHDRHGLRYPTHCEPIPANEIDLVITPGLGFDEQGNRLGKGGGFYDRFLSNDGFSGIVCGLAFEEQCVNNIPIDKHDVQLDMLVTDRDVRHFNKTTC